MSFSITLEFKNGKKLVIDEKMSTYLEFHLANLSDKFQNFSVGGQNYILSEIMFIHIHAHE